MATAKTKTRYCCSDCGYETAKWLGRCPSCSAWNTMVEEKVVKPTNSAQAKRTFRLPSQQQARGSQPVKLNEIKSSDVLRVPTGLGEFDRVLGGGLVAGAMILVGGDPGIGKSTILLQAMASIAQAQPKRAVLYVSGEESLEQVKLRASRMGLNSDNILLLAETRTDTIAQVIEENDLSAVVVDSVQAIYDPEVESAPGSVSQIREVAARLLYLAKAKGTPCFLVGHVTKDGAIAGPRVLEHLVDTVLYFESSTNSLYRVLRAHKNRFGSTNEIGVFEMSEAGLKEVDNPSELFLAERPEHAPGSVVLPAMEGTRTILVEVQALVTPSAYGNPRRTCLGFDSHRAALLAAVLERRVGLQLSGHDVFVNIAGGLKLNEPAADLAVAVALASSFKNRAIDPKAVVFGEVGLAGELRMVTQTEIRLAEARKLGFHKALCPASQKGKKGRGAPQLLEARNLEEAIDLVEST